MNSTNDAPAPALKEGDIAYTKVRIDSDPKDGWAFMTPANHPEDIEFGRVEGEWDEGSQFFGEVCALAPAGSPSAEDVLRERVAELEAVASEAIDEIEIWAAYASDYFKDKHDLAGVLADLRARTGGRTDAE